MRRLARLRSLSSVLGAGVCTAVLVAGCTQLLGADWDGHAAESTKGATGSESDGATGEAGTTDGASDGLTTGDGGVPTAANAIGLAASHSCALDVQGRVHCWGDNASGQAGQRVGLVPFEEKAVLVPTPEALSVVAGGFMFNCVLAKSGKVYCWGSNSSGELGRTLEGPRLVDEKPGLVEGLAEPAVALAARSDTACVTLASGKVACWGRSVSTLDTTNRPVLVQGLANAESIGVGRGHACVVRRDGSVACWGKNDKRQLGTDGVASSATAIDVALPGPASGVVAGSAFSCALLTSGAVYCWGDASLGQLGPGASAVTPREIPTLVPGFSDARSLAAGDEHTCVATARGTVVCWGNDDDGRLGGASLDGGTVEVFGLSARADQVGAGKSHSCAKLGDASPMCWGANESGQLGSSRLQQGPAPRTVLEW